VPAGSKNLNSIHLVGDPGDINFQNERRLGKWTGAGGRRGRLGIGIRVYVYPAVVAIVAVVAGMLTDLEQR